MPNYSKLAQVADDVVDLITAGNVAEAFDTSVTAVRGFDTTQLLKDTNALKCDVVPASLVLTARSRHFRRYIATVDIAIRKRLGDDALTTQTGRLVNSYVDALMLLTEQIHEYLAGLTRATLANSGAGYVSGEITLPFHPDHIIEDRQFTSVQNVKYQLEVDVTGA